MTVKAIWQYKVAQYTIAIVACIAVICFLIGTSDSFQDCEHTRKKHKPYQALQKERSSLVHDIIRLKLHAACTRVTVGENDGSIIAIFTILLALYTVRLATATDRLVKGAEDTAKKQLRAYIAVKPVGIKKFTPNSVMEVEVVMENYGQTPAYNVTNHGIVAIAGNPIPDGFEINPPLPRHPSSTTIHPRDSSIARNTQIRAITAEEFDAVIKSDQIAFYVLSIATYKDVFGDQQTTQILVSVPRIDLLSIVHGGDGATVRFIYNKEHTWAT